MKNDFTTTPHPLRAAIKAAWNWTKSGEGMPLKVSAVGAVTCVVASIGVGLPFAAELDDRMKAEQMESCRNITHKTDAELQTIRAKCLETYPGIFGP